MQIIQNAMEFWIQMGVSYPQSRITEMFKIYCMEGIFKKMFWTS
jgi:hypothetical protein